MGCCGDVNRKILQLLHKSGAVRRTSKKHRHFVFPDGRVWIVPNSPKSDSGYYHNLADLKKYLNAQRYSD
jgi:ribosomal protein S19E (S16A)